MIHVKTSLPDACFFIMRAIALFETVLFYSFSPSSTFQLLQIKMADRSNTNATFAQEDVMVKGSKKLLYAKLNAELGKLETNMKALEDNIKVTAAQVPSVRKMGNMHSSL